MDAKGRSGATLGSASPTVTGSTSSRADSLFQTRLISDCCRTLAPVLSLTVGLQRGPPGSTPSEPSGTHQAGILGAPPPARGRLPVPRLALAQLTWSPGSPAGFTCGFPGAPAPLLTPPDLRGGWATSSALNALLSCICSASRDRAKRGRPGGKGGSCFHQPITSCPGPPCGPPAPSVNRRWEQAFSGGVSRSSLQ